METQKIVNFLNSSENGYSKFATKIWYVIDSESKGIYSHDNPINFLTKSIESSLMLQVMIIIKGNNHLMQLHMQILLILQCLCTI